MKGTLLTAGFMLTASLHAGNGSQSDKNEIVKEHKVLTGLRATGAALGAGAALYTSYRYYLLINASGTSNIVKWACLGPYLFPAYKLGRKALTLTGVVQAGDQFISQENEVEKEQKLVSGLKMAGAAIGSTLGLLYAAGYSQILLTSKITGFNQISALNAIGLFCGAYTAYELGCEAVFRAKRLLEK